MKDNIGPSPEHKSPEMSGARFCMVCLNTSEDCKLYAANTYNLDMEFEHLTRISLQGLTDFEAQFCTECAQRLSNCSKFRDRSLKAYHLLKSWVEEHETLTIQDVIALGRTNNLTSSITKKSFEPDHCDLHFKHKEREKNKKVRKSKGNIDKETPDNKVSIEIECVNGSLILNPVKENDNSVNNQTGDENNGNDGDDDDFENDDLSDSDDESDSRSTGTNKESDSEIKSKLDKRTRPLKVEALLKLYKIKELTREEQLADLEKRKERVNSNTAYHHKCLKCYKGFFGVQHYKKHMEKHTDKHGKCECPVCGVRYHTEKQTKRHVANVHRRRFSCNSCTLVTNEKATAVKHLNWHKKDYFTCPHCLEELKAKSLYLAHLRQVHCSELSCTLCQRAFKNERGLRSHITRKHYSQHENPKNPKSFCEECNIHLPSETAYYQHLMDSHLKEIPATDTNLKRKAQEMISNPKDDAKKRRLSGQLEENLVSKQDTDEEIHYFDSKMENFEDIPTEYLEDFDDIDLQSQVNSEDTKNSKGTRDNIKEYKSTTIEDSILDPKVTWKSLRNPDLEYLKQYTITELTHQEQCEDVEKRRESANFLNSEFKCEICFKGFCYSNTYKMHMDKHTDKYGQFECPVCFLRFPKRIRLRNHILSNHSRRFACTSCSLVTNHRSTAFNHAKWHKGTVYQCPHCPEVSLTKSASLSHIRIAHPGDVLCALCGFCFRNERGLQKHLHVKHRLDNVQNPAGPLCEPCGVRFATDAAFQQHLKVAPKHTAGRKLMRNAPLLKGSKNRKKNTTNEPITCEQCGLRLRNHGAYYRHFRAEHPDRARTKLPRAAQLCELCGDAFAFRAQLRKHMLKHAGRRSYTCDTCGRAFYTKADIALHVGTHGRAAHACPVCGRRFVNKQNRDRHVWIHKKRKPFPCSECERTFPNESTRRGHAARAHPSPPAELGAQVEQPTPIVEKLED